MEVVCDGDGGRANDGDFEVDAEYSQKKAAESHLSEKEGSTGLHDSQINPQTWLLTLL